MPERMTLWAFLKSQFITLPYPEQDCSGKTFIVTGGNSGLGLEAARHFVRLNAAKVVIACRNLDKGAAAKKSIEESVKQQQHDVVEVWQLDLASFESVKEFAQRTNQLARVDALVNNASVMATTVQRAEGHEIQITTNVISTTLLSLLLLPALRRTAKQFNVVPRIATVSSDGSFTARFVERNEEKIFPALNACRDITDRYSTTKLLQLMVTKNMAEAVDASDRGHVIINALNPGLCKTQLFREFWFPLNLIVQLAFVLLARDAEMGSRTLVTAALAGEETHGNWMTDCRLHLWPTIMKGENGDKLSRRVWEELLEVIEEIQPGVTDLL